MNCDCSIECYDEPSVYRETVRRARKAWRCCECGEVIASGEQYQEATGVWDGQWSTYRTCLPCAAMRRDLSAYGWCFGELGVAVSECLGFDPYCAEEEDDDA